jgi:hypothetical protein
MSEYFFRAAFALANENGNTYVNNFKLKKILRKLMLPAAFKLQQGSPSTSVHTRPSSQCNCTWFPFHPIILATDINYQFSGY